MSQKPSNSTSVSCPFNHAYSVGHNVRKHFDWPNVHEVMKKVKEEIQELDEVLDKTPTEQIHELGDVLFTLVQVARHLNIDPKDSLALCNARHEQRMERMKLLIQEDGKIFEEQSLEELESYWVKAKNTLKPKEKQMISDYLTKKF